MSIRERTEAWEEQYLSPWASHAARSQGRPIQEEPDPIRTSFQRDRDRILHCRSFRRLKHKTQVFIDPTGDHFRTRLTHTLEVSQIARTISRALRLNEDLTEAIALGHDIGHPPFGHAGEAAIDEFVAALDPSSAFRHYEQSVRVLQLLESNGHGLNLTRETLQGIAGHSKGRADIENGGDVATGSLEASVVRVADRIAYLNHDLDDAIRSGWFTEDGLPEFVWRWGSSHSERIGASVHDVVRESADSEAVKFSGAMLDWLNELKEFMFNEFYLEYPRKFGDIGKAQRLVRALLIHFTEHMELLPSSYRNQDGVIDYVAGMTDRFAIGTFEGLFIPSSWR